MNNLPASSPVPGEPSEGEIRDYAYQLYQRSSCAPGHDLDNWLEAIACLKANIPAHQSGIRLHQPVNGPSPSELQAVTIGAGTLFS
jgi:hypothetical protein